ncbi:MAG: DUF1573 domain-containing protein [Saprospiraceae bacterium]|nr:DUF1573 domain-containing protein [Saprospiraceae bacterium]
MLALALNLLLVLQSPFILAPAFEWTTPVEHDFGDIPQGKPVNYLFKFKNTGDAPLQIENVRFTCSCTATEWTENPVLPGKEGSVNVTFDARKLGYFSKKITVFFMHQRKAEKLHIEGFVE